MLTTTAGYFAGIDFIYEMFVVFWEFVIFSIFNFYCLYTVTGFIEESVMLSEVSTFLTVFIAAGAIGWVFYDPSDFWSSVGEA